jgi:defect-in-organelle-trafficking protein DotB
MLDNHESKSTLTGIQHSVSDVSDSVGLSRGPEMEHSEQDSVAEYPGNTSFMNVDVANDILKWSIEQDASDIAFAPNEAIWMRRYGEWVRITKRRLTTHEISLLLDQFSRQPSASSQTKSGQDIDFPYEVTLSRGKRARFRCNGTGCRDNWSQGISIVMRTIPEFPAKIETMDLPEHLIRAFKPKYGLVLVTGPVGSGKSTLLSSVLRDIAESERKHIITYEAPIEFDLMGLPDKKSLVVQTEVPNHLHSFGVAPRNSLRRAGDVILFGEARDQETLKNMSIEAETGVAVYSTVHTNSVSETISRMVREFPENERDGMAATLVAALRLIVHQRLVVRADGKGRVAIREWLEFTDTIRDILVRTPIKDMIHVTENLVQRYGRSLMVDVTEKYSQGLISSQEYDLYAQVKASAAGTAASSCDEPVTCTDADMRPTATYTNLQEVME